MCSSVENYLPLDEYICDASVRYINWERFKTGATKDTPAIVIINRINVNDYVRPDNAVLSCEGPLLSPFLLFCYVNLIKLNILRP